MPDQLIGQIEAFVPPLEALAEGLGQPHLIHADLTADHLLGRVEGGRWITTGLIDFGDAMIGDLYYELVPLHLDLFHADKRLLATFLRSYGVDEAMLRIVPTRALAAALLHRFDVFGPTFAAHPWARDARSLEELADLLWDVERPGASEM